MKNSRPRTDVGVAAQTGIVFYFELIVLMTFRDPLGVILYYVHIREKYKKILSS